MTRPAYDHPCVSGPRRPVIMGPPRRPHRLRPCLAKSRAAQLAWLRPWMRGDRPAGQAGRTCKHAKTCYGLGCEAIAPPRSGIWFGAMAGARRPISAPECKCTALRTAGRRPHRHHVKPKIEEPAAGPAATRILSAMRCLLECQRKRHHGAGAAARLAARSRRLHKSPTTATARTRHCRTARACR